MLAFDYFLSDSLSLNVSSMNLHIILLQSIENEIIEPG